MLKRSSQFTLIELIIVIVVLGIIASIVLPNVQSVKGKARKTSQIADLRNMQTSLDLYRMDASDLDMSMLVDMDADSLNGVNAKVVEIDGKKYAFLNHFSLNYFNVVKKIPSYLVDTDNFAYVDASKGQAIVAVELLKDDASTGYVSPIAGNDVPVKVEDIEGHVVYLRDSKVLLD